MQRGVFGGLGKEIEEGIAKEEEETKHIEKDIEELENEVEEMQKLLEEANEADNLLE